MSTLKKTIILLMISALGFNSAGAQDLVSAAETVKIKITNFNVYEKNDQLFIDWATDGTVAANYWELQSSTDGKQFKTFALVFGPDPRQQGDRYQFKGKIRNADGTELIYRVCPVDSNEKEIITEIITPAK